MPAKRTQKRLVIDTNIARSVSETTNPTSINCRNFLEKMRDLEFRLVISQELLEEWNRHRSRFFLRWLSQMFARKLQVQVNDVENDTLRSQIEKHASSEKDAEEMLKDVLLLEAALVTDKTVVSMNEIDRKRFAEICEHIALIRDVVWANPDITDEKCLEWLEEGAPDDDFRKLGYEG
jgi:hypothetical protein